MGWRYRTPKIGRSFSGEEINLNPYDLIISILPTLSPVDIERVAKEVFKRIPTPCDSKGHDYQFVEISRKRFLFFNYTEEKLYCKRCGCTRDI
jgi:hypothetical protein